MAKKKKTTPPPKQEVFRNNAFSNLKGVAVSAVPQQNVCKQPPALKPEPDLSPDYDLFLEAMSDVRPLSKQASASSVPTPKKTAATVTPPAESGKTVLDKKEKEAFAAAISQLKLDVTFSDSVPENDEIKSLGANRLRQLKRGIITVNRQLDLHGLTREEALEALAHFLRSAVAYKEKAVLVITGKGLNSPGEPVLQQAVAGWLRESGKKLVLEFAPAPREMGGHGAFVVFLRV
jgi:DNA-nicking Smr family endonuclease